MKLVFATLDVFTTSRYSGNPLAIVKVPASLRDKLSEEQKQKIAAEFNLSETVFLHEVVPEAVVVDYDIFSSRIRIPFAGHPTVGTAIYVMNYARSEFPAVTRLRTPLAGNVPIEYMHDSGRASVSVPHNVHIHKTRLPHPLPASETNPSHSDSVPLVSIVRGMAFALVPLSTLDALGSVSSGVVPATDVYNCQHLDDGWDTGHTGTLYYCDQTDWAKSEEKEEVFDDVRVIRTRMLARIEDPGTGSASSALCCFLAYQQPKRLGAIFRYHLIQGVEMGRRCDIFVNVAMSQVQEAIIDRVELAGTAIPVMDGTLET